MSPILGWAGIFAPKTETCLGVLDAIPDQFLKLSGYRHRLTAARRSYGRGHEQAATPASPRAALVRLRHAVNDGGISNRRLARHCYHGVAQLTAPLRRLRQGGAALCLVLAVTSGAFGGSQGFVPTSTWIESDGAEPAVAAFTVTLKPSSPNAFARLTAGVLHRSDFNSSNSTANPAKRVNIPESGFPCVFNVTPVVPFHDCHFHPAFSRTSAIWLINAVGSGFGFTDIENGVPVNAEIFAAIRITDSGVNERGALNFANSACAASARAFASAIAARASSPSVVSRAASFVNCAISNFRALSNASRCGFAQRPVMYSAANAMTTTINALSAIQSQKVAQYSAPIKSVAVMARLDDDLGLMAGLAALAVLIRRRNRRKG
jgi:hypothetical protein